MRLSRRNVAVNLVCVNANLAVGALHAHEVADGGAADADRGRGVDFREVFKGGTAPGDTGAVDAASGGDEVEEGGAEGGGAGVEARVGVGGAVEVELGRGDGADGPADRGEVLAGLLHDEDEDGAALLAGKGVVELELAAVGAQASTLAHLAGVDAGKADDEESGVVYCVGESGVEAGGGGSVTELILVKPGGESELLDPGGDLLDPLMVVAALFVGLPVVGEEEVVLFALALLRRNARQLDVGQTWPTVLSSCHLGIWKKDVSPFG